MEMAEVISNRKANDRLSSGEKIDYYQRLMKKTMDEEIPFSVVWELTDKCNLRCAHCYVVPDYKREELSLSEIKTILDQLARAGCLYLIFTGGEIFTRDDFFDISRYARRKGFGLRLLTNGTLLTAETADELKDIQPLSVEISLYGLSPSVHEAITRVPGSYSKTIRAFKLLKERKIKAVIKSPLMRKNIGEFDRLKRFAEEAGSGFVFDFNISARDNGCTTPHKFRLSDSNLRQFFSQKVELSRGRRAEIKDDTPTCNAGLNMAFISPYGEVHPCLAIRERCGDLRKERFSQIWEKSQVLSETRSIRFSDLSECLDCRLLRYCDRCQGTALLEDGDILSPSKAACRIAEIHESVLKEKDRKRRKRDREVSA